MCNCEPHFLHLRDLSSPLTITLGDGSTLQAAGRDNVILRMRLPHGKAEDCTLYDVLYVPGLAYNLLSVPVAARRSKVTTFSGSSCEIKSSKGRLVACGHREGSLYYLDYDGIKEQVHSTCYSEKANGTIWHRRLGYLGFCSLQSLQKHCMVDGLDLDHLPEIGFCESG